MSRYAGFLMGCTLIACSIPATLPAKAQDDGYYGIPPGYDFPANRETLERYRTTQDIAALRLHAWNVWAGMNQPTPDGTARWETWYRSSETFRVGPAPQGERRIVREFRQPRQLMPEPGPSPQAAGQSLLSFVLFNKEAHEFIRSNQLFLKSKLEDLNSTFPENTPWNERAIPAFPAEATALKVVWWPVAGDTVTAMPIWDFEPTQDAAAGNEGDALKRKVATWQVLHLGVP